MACTTNIYDKRNTQQSTNNKSKVKSDERIF